MTVFDRYYSEYKDNLDGFSRFHNEVINMPRDQFSDTGLQKVRMLAGYLLLTEGKLDDTGNSYKETMLCIRNEINLGNFPHYRDEDMEERYFTFGNINTQYEVQGRMFRHLMGLCAFFGFVTSLDRDHKIFNYDKCREYYLSDDTILMPIARNNIASLNIKDNDYIKALKGITINNEADYRPTYGILRYMHDIRRPATKFELSVLLGRIDDLKTENDIIRRALDIGRILPETLQAQIPYFFSNMEWKHADGTFYTYAASQEPYFKFNSYLLLLENFNLIEFNNVTSAYTLTEYAESIIEDDVSYLIADLEALVALIGSNEDRESRELNDLILNQRNPELLKLAKEDATFITKMNKRSLDKPTYDKYGRRQRNRLIAELAKIQADYMCQYAQRHIFKMPNGKYYCEAHHIIEFNTEDGPDITNNLVVLGPEAHMIIHHACQEEVDNVFLQLTRNGVLTFDRFKEMITVYHCLTISQVNVLFSKHIITLSEKDELLELLA